MAGVYFYLFATFIIFVFLLYKVVSRKRQENKNYEEREDNVFYDAVKKVRRD